MYMYHSQEPPEEQQQSEAVIQPGGDPDAGMPADQAEIHGIERQPATQHTPHHQDTNKQGHPPDNDPNEEHYPPVNNDPDDPPFTMSSNEQGHPPVRTSPAEQGHPPVTDSIDNIDEDMTPIDNTIDSNKNVTLTSIPKTA